MANFLIVEARFYDGFNDMLISGAKAALEEAGHAVETLTVPGALEIPAQSPWLLRPDATMVSWLSAW